MARTYRRTVQMGDPSHPHHRSRRSASSYSVIARKHPGDVHAPVRIVTWNCLSVYPQHYDDWKRDPTPALATSLKRNAQRYAHHVRALSPHFERLEHGTLDAVCLQEVDAALVALLVKRARKQYPALCLHPQELADTPYVKYGDHAYHLLTFVHRKRRVRGPIYNRLSRFAVSPLDTVVVVNAHIPWVPPPTPDVLANPSDRYVVRHAKNQKVLNALQHCYKRSKQQQCVVCGDLNLSSADNQQVFADAFHLGPWDETTGMGMAKNPRIQVHAMGESYNIKPEHVQDLKTFRALAKAPDDGVLCDARMKVTVTFDSLHTKRLPVDANGFVALTAKHSPSDHALVEVVVEEA